MDNLLQRKWRKLLNRSRLFRFIPFVDFVLISGSMAVGGVHENSDFDVIAGVKKERIFTARFFCVLFFGILDWRRAKNDKGKAAADKFCFSHFVTPAAYRLSEPHTDSWRKIYLSLVPIYGEKSLIQNFFDANSDWLGQERLYSDDPRHIYKKKSLFQYILEKLLSGYFGLKIEEALKKIQLKRIKTSLKSETEKGYKPRIIFNEEELEFHPDTSRDYNA